MTIATWGYLGMGLLYFAVVVLAWRQAGEADRRETAAFRRYRSRERVQ